MLVSDRLSALLQWQRGSGQNHFPVLQETEGEANLEPVLVGTGSQFFSHPADAFHPVR